MKRKCSVFILTMLVMLQAFAVPAHKGSVKVSQPDGSVVTLRLHGDEYLHFTTTDDGYSVVKNEQGAYVYAQLDDEGQLAPTAIVAHDAAERKVAEVAYLQGVKKGLMPVMTAQSNQMMQTNRALAAKARQAVAAKAPQYDYNNFKGLVILVEFNDKQFSRTDYKTIINNMINKENYTGFTDTSGRKQTYTGSVRDYFSDNSGGKFKPQFDVYGPYKVNYSQYYPQGANNAGKILSAAVTAADADINFKDYDRDNDGIVDMIFFMLAGNGANYGGNDSRLWWPHRSAMYNNGYVIKDGVYLWDYASSVELAGFTDYPSTVMIDGIGTICHEFSHVLGLPDFYDADYSGSGGESVHPGEWSVMAGGSYMNDGRTPVGYSLFERYAIGFATPEVISAEGSYSLPAISSSNTGYRINTLNSEEFFMLENRRNSAKWDAYLPGSGMLVFRVDSTNAQIWEQNAVNNNPEHNYYELLRAGGYQNKAAASDPFPGSSNVTELTNITLPANLKTWDGKTSLLGLTNIRMNNGIVTFDVIDVNVLSELSLPESQMLSIGMQLKLTPILFPETAKNKLTWSSDDQSVAIVDQTGRLTAIASGKTNIRVTSDNNLSATCQVTVADMPSAANIAALMALDDETQACLQLTDAQVLYVYNDNIYLRDATGCVVLSNSQLDVSKNSILDGAILIQKKTVNDIPMVQPIDGFDVASCVSTDSGTEAVPHTLLLSELTNVHYADLITLQSVEMKKTSVAGLNGLYAVNGDTYVRLFNTFGVKGITVPTQYEDVRFDVTGILITRVSNGTIVKELALMKSPRITTTDAIEQLRPTADATPVYYTLTGRRVNNVVAPGLYIVQQGGKLRKVLVK